MATKKKVPTAKISKGKEPKASANLSNTYSISGKAKKR